MGTGSVVDLPLPVYTRKRCSVDCKFVFVHEQSHLFLLFLYCRSNLAECLNPFFIGAVILWRFQRVIEREQRDSGGSSKD